MLSGAVGLSGRLAGGLLGGWRLVLVAAALCVCVSLVNVLTTTNALCIMHCIAVLLHTTVQGGTLCTTCDVSRSASITNSMLLLVLCLPRICWLAYLVAGLSGRLAGWPIGRWGYWGMEHVREYTYYIAYTLYTRARVRGLLLSCATSGVVCIASLYYTTYLLYYGMHIYVYTTCRLIGEYALWHYALR